VFLDDHAEAPERGLGEAV